MSKKLICMSSAFGYGPVSKLLAVAAVLKPLDYQLVFAGRGPALELASHFPFNEFILWEDENGSHALEKELHSADGIVNVMDARVEALIHPLPIPHFYIDSLFWMWSRLHPRAAQADIYFIQNFPGVYAKVKEWQGLIRNPQIVGPIIDLSGLVRGEPEQLQGLIINFGGLESRSVKDGGEYLYASLLTGLMLPFLEELPLENVIFTGNKRVMALLAQQFSSASGRIQFTHFSHQEFIARLNNAQLLLSSPGLTTTYEAFWLNVPVRFLPPQNYSQTLMLDQYRTDSLVDRSLHWKDVYPEYQIRPGMEVSEAMQSIHSTMDTFSGDLAAQEKARRILGRMIHEPVKPVQCLGQKEFARKMGMPSPEVIAHSITSYLK
jgi:hypothetical protein